MVRTESTRKQQTYEAKLNLCQNRAINLNTTIRQITKRNESKIAVMVD